MENIFTKNLVTINDNSLLDEADDLMNKYKIRHLPVVDNNDFLIGMLSKSDYIALKQVDSRLDKYDVRSFMCSKLVFVKKTASISEVAKKFINKKISSVLIVENDKIIGIITSEDLISLLAKDDNFICLPEKFYSTSLTSENLQII